VICPECDGGKLRTLETRQHEDNSVFRRKACDACGLQVRTLEVVQEDVKRPLRQWKRKPGPRKGKKQPGVNRALGETNAASVLTVRDVKTLRQLAAKGVLQKTLAVQYGIAPGTVSRIVRRELWAHVV
jgi:transcriptional regulator NrdR family protein